MKVTERAVVSIGTVSRVLNNDIRVAPDARDRVFVVTCELGCVPNLAKSRVDRFLPIPLRKLADYIDTLTNTSFPLVSIDHQGTGSLCADVGTRYGECQLSLSRLRLRRCGVDVFAEPTF